MSSEQLINLLCINQAALGGQLATLQMENRRLKQDIVDIANKLNNIVEAMNCLPPMRGYSYDEVKKQWGYVGY